MIFNYIKIAFRNLLKNKGFSFLNIFGLAIGITCASLIFLWAEDEINFDSVFPNKDQVYYVIINHKYDGEWRTSYATPGPLAKALKNEIPGILRATRTSIQDMMFTVGQNAINKTGRYVDIDIFEIFSLPFIEGNAIDAFKNPEAIVLSKETAVQLYGENTKVLGKTIRVDNKTNYIITGVIDNLPENVTFDFNWLAPFERYAKGEAWMTKYGNNFADTFVQLSAKANFETVDAKVRKIIAEKRGRSGGDYAFLHAMNDWHLRSNFEGGKKVGGAIIYVRLFTIIALIILAIACINFMNLSTAQSEKRANEVGVRKAIGSDRKSLIFQFITEALLMTTIATILSIILLLVLLPQFNLLIEKNLVLGLTNPLHITSLLSITLICGIFAGLYPAFYLSSFKPVDVLKGIKTTHGSASFIRRGLIIGQFVISIIFIISTILVYQQIQHVKNRELGYNKEQLITMKVQGDMVKNFSVIKQEMLNTGMIENVALNSLETLSTGNNGSGVYWEGIDKSNDFLVSYRYITPEFLSTAGMEVVDGRDFYTDSEKDTTRVVITQSLARIMGQGSAVGKIIGSRGKQREIIGVIKDYVYGDMYGTSDPVIFFYDPEQENKKFAYTYMYVKTKSNIATNEILSTMKKVMQKNNPAFPFEYSFVDDKFNEKFKSEQLVGKLSQLFALLAILISCLGLFGLAAYTAEQRRKEIGVRKVLGASVLGVVKLLSKDFIKLVGISVIISIPIAWYVMHNWLQGFAYRISINWWVFILAGFTALLIAMITVSYQAIRAATANPVKSLRTE